MRLLLLLLRDEALLAAQALRDRRLALLLALFAALLLLAAQIPLFYQVDVGREEGPGSDLPILAGFFPRERDRYGTFRWTREASFMRLPGIGTRPLHLTLRFIPVSEEVVRRGPRELALWANGVFVAQLPVRPPGAIYRVALPSQPSGDMLLELRSATFVPTGDQRAIGAGLLAFTAAAPAGPAFPAWRSTLLWLTALGCAWLAVRRAGFGSDAAFLLLLPAVLLAGLAALFDPPRFAFGAEPALVALALGWALAIVLRRTGESHELHEFARISNHVRRTGESHELHEFARISNHVRSRWLNVDAVDAQVSAGSIWRWLTLLAVVTFVARYGGKIYPDAMPGDIGFHVNRFVDVAYGEVLLVSRNRGVDFPYPPGLYLLLVPFTLLGVGRDAALQFGAALLDALSVFLVYAIAAAVLHTSHAKAQRRKEVREHGSYPFASFAPLGVNTGGGLNVPLAAAGIYTLSAAGFMTTWWNFSTHIFAQFAHLLLIAMLVAGWPLLKRPGRMALPLLAGLVVSQSLVFLGHFGFWMNMSLLGGLGLVALFVAAWHRRASWETFRLLLAAFVVAQALAALLFYTGYTGLFLAQLQAAASGGLTGLAGRAPLDRGTLWRILWEFGLVTHFGFFPLPLALCGVLMLRPAHGARGVALVLISGTLVIALGFAVLPFLTGSTLSSRWLMFSAWVVAVGAAFGVARLWQRGAAGRIVALAAGAFVVWGTASLWLAAMVWRVRPPEPF